MGANMLDVAPIAKKKKKLVTMDMLIARPKLTKIAKLIEDHLVDDALKDSLSNTFLVFINIIILCLE